MSVFNDFVGVKALATTAAHKAFAFKVRENIEASFRSSICCLVLFP